MRIIADGKGRPAPAAQGTGLTAVYGTAPLVLTLTGSVLTGSVSGTLAGLTAGRVPVASSPNALEDSHIWQDASGVVVAPRDVASDDYTGVRVGYSGEVTTITALSADPLLPDTNPVLSLVAANASGSYGVDVGSSAVTVAAQGALSTSHLSVAPGEIRLRPHLSSDDVITVMHHPGTDEVRLGFFGATPTIRNDVTGSRGGNAALQSLLVKLAALGLITDLTS